jgi:UPF0716 family protein affecting phage T7 exclusion
MATESFPSTPSACQQKKPPSLDLGNGGFLLFAAGLSLLPRLLVGLFVFVVQIPVVNTTLTHNLRMHLVDHMSIFLACWGRVWLCCRTFDNK